MSNETIYDVNQISLLNLDAQFLKRTLHSDAKSLIYVVDLSNRAHVSASCIQMLELLSSPHLAQKPVLILLNKIDAPSRMKRNFFASLVRLDDMMHHAEQPITVLEISAISGHGLGAVHQWLIDNHGH